MSKEPKRNVYVGHRYVPKIMGEWNNEQSYEGLSIVTHQGTSYTSKKHVPVGIDILDEEYWVVTGNYNAQIEHYRQEVRDMKDQVDSKANQTDLDETNQRLTQKLNQEDFYAELEKSIYTEGYNIERYFDSITNTEYWITIINTDENTPIKFGYAKGEGKTVRQYAYENNTTLSFNSSLGSSTIMIVDREIIGDDVPANYDTLAITTDNDIFTIPAGKTPSQILDEYPNVVSVHGGFEPLYEYGERVETDRFPHFKKKHPRQVIGKLSNGDIFFLTTGGRGFGGEGMTTDDIFRVLQGIPYTYLYMLDGGGSTSLVEKGVLINKPIDDNGNSERKLPGTINLMSGDNKRKSAFEIMELTKFLGDISLKTNTQFNPKTTDNLNTLVENGFYWVGWRADGAPQPSLEGSSTSSWLVLHITYSEKDKIQFAIEYGNNYNLSIRRTNATTGEWIAWRNSKDFVDNRFSIQVVNDIDNISETGHYWVDVDTPNVPEGVDTNTWYLENIVFSDGNKFQLIYPYALEETPKNVYRRRTTQGGENWTQWK